MNKAVTKRVAMHGTGREYLRRLSADIRRDRWLYARCSFRAWSTFWFSSICPCGAL